MDALKTRRATTLVLAGRRMVTPLPKNIDRPNADIGERPQRGGQVEAVLGRAERWRDGTILIWVRNPPTPLNSVLESKSGLL